MDTLPTVRAAVVQASPVFLDRDATVEKALRLIEEAGRQGAQVVVFPETWIPGYPIWASRIQSWRELRAGHRLFVRLYRNAVEVPSPVVDALCRAARKAEVYVVMGINEREGEFGRSTLYNTILFIGRDGRLLGKHRKLMPTFHERTIWGMGDGSGLRVYETDIGRLGGLICWEHWMPLTGYALWVQGEQVHAALWPWPSPYGPSTVEGEMHQVANRHYAYQGRCFVLSSCAWLTKGDLPNDFELAEQAQGWEDPLLVGGSAIIGPNGRYLAGPLYEGEGILYADLDLHEIPARKQSLDVVGHYARPDVFQVTISRARQVPATFQEPPVPLRPEQVPDEL